MSKELDEAGLAQDVYDEIVNYGREATFTVKGTPDVDHTWWISPPVTEYELMPSSTEEQEFMDFLIPDLNIQFNPRRIMKFTDGSTTYRIVHIKPLDSGSRRAAWKIRVAR